MSRRVFVAALLGMSPSCAACTDYTRGYVDVSIEPSLSSIGFQVEGDGVVMLIDTTMLLEEYEEGVVHIDSVEVVARVDGETMVYDHPAIRTEDFPVNEAASTERVSAVFVVPSPINDADKLESRCLANGRSLRLTVRLYATQNDSGNSETPRLIETTETLPLIPRDDSPPANVFGSPALLSIDTMAPSYRPPRLSRGAGDDVLITLEDFAGNPVTGEPGTYRFWRADPDSVEQIHVTDSDFSDTPRASLTAEGGAFAGGLSALGPLAISLRAFDSTGEAVSSSEINVVARQLREPYRTLRLVHLAPSSNGAYVVVQSAYSLEGPLGPVVPAAGKDHGSFLFEVANDLTVLSASSLDRDLLFIESLSDGGTLIATSALPPRDDTATLVIERRDPAGATLWSYEQDSLVEELAVRPTEDGGAIATFVDPRVTNTIEVIRIGPDGSRGYHYTATGYAPSVAINDAGLALVSFVGILPGIGLPTRFVPLLVELSDEGVPVRAAQVACGGLGVVGNDWGNGVILAGFFDERVSIGTTTVAVDGQISVSAVE